MGLFSFKEWLDKEQPDVTNFGEPNNNADARFGLQGAKSKIAMSTTKSGQVDFDPEQKFICTKCNKKKGQSK